MKISFWHLIITLILYFIIINNSFSQNRIVIDSLLSVLEKDISDKERVDLNVQLAYEYFFTETDESLKHAKEALKLSRKIAYKKGEINANIKLANLFRKKGDYTKSLDLLNEALQKSKEINYKIGEADAYRGLGIFYDIKNKYQFSLDNYKKSLAICETIKYKNGILWATNNMATLHVSMGYYDKALKLNLKILNNEDFKEDKILLSDSYGNIGNIYNNKGDYEKGLENHFKSLELSEEKGSKHDKALTYNNIGNSYLLKGKYNKALDFYSKSLQLKEELGDKENIYSSLLNISLVYKNKGNYEQALNYLYRGLKINNELENKSGLGAVYLGIADIYSTQNNYDKALEFNNKSLKLYKEIGLNKGIGSSLTNIGVIYKKQEKYEKALENYFQAEEIFKNHQNKRELAIVYTSIGIIFEQQNKDKEAQVYLKKALAISDEINSYSTSIHPLIVIGRINQKKNRFIDAKSYYEKAFSLASKIGETESIEESLIHLSRIEKKLGNYKKALEQYEYYTKLTDSLSSNKLIRKMAKMEAEHAYNKQKDSIQFTNIKEKIKLNQTIQNQKLIQYLSLAGLVILLGVIFILYQYYTSKKEANVLLNKQKDELASLDKHKSRFFANISHELRTPITLIKGPLEYVLEKEEQSLSKDVKKYLQLIKRNTKKLSNLVDDILDLSKLDANKMEVYLESTDILYFITRVFESYRSLADQLGITYNLNITIPTATFVMLDKSKTEKILNNLLSNAIKHTPENGMVNLNCSIRNNELNFQVKDTGSGIPRKDLPFIFDRYFQSKQPNTPIQGGTGIGLSLTKEYVKLLDGTINAESIIGQGSTFVLMLPYIIAKKVKNNHQEVRQLSDDKDDLIEDIKIRVHKNQKANHRILIVEDQPELLRFLKSLLEDTYQIAIAMNGKQALKHLSKNSVDLIISDVMMPEMNGFELLKEVRDNKLHQSIPIIMLTALGDEANKLDALSMGVDDYLAKPFASKELIARVENMLARYAIRKEQVESEIEADSNSEDNFTKEGLGRGKNFIQKVEKRMIQELENEEFSVEKIAEEFFLSSSQFRRKIKQYTGLSPKQLQREIALQKSRDLLEAKQYGNLTAVAHSVGIRNVTRFSKLYEERFGKKPSEYFLEIGLT